MNNTMNWSAVAPEIVLLTMACVIALVDLFVTDAQRRPTFWLTQASLAAVALLHLARLDSAQSVYAMQGMFVSDPLGHLLAFFATVAVMITDRLRAALHRRARDVEGRVLHARAVRRCSACA